MMVTLSMISRDTVPFLLSRTLTTSIMRLAVPFTSALIATTLRGRLVSVVQSSLVVILIIKTSPFLMSGTGISSGSLAPVGPCSPSSSSRMSPNFSLSLSLKSVCMDMAVGELIC